MCLILKSILSGDPWTLERSIEGMQGFTSPKIVGNIFLACVFTSEQKAHGFHQTFMIFVYPF